MTLVHWGKKKKKANRTWKLRTAISFLERRVVSRKVGDLGCAQYITFAYFSVKITKRCYQTMFNTVLPDLWIALLLAIYYVKIAKHT